MINNVRIFLAMMQSATSLLRYSNVELNYQHTGIVRTNSLALIRKIVKIFMPVAKKHDAFVHREPLNCASHQIKRSFPGQATENIQRLHIINIDIT